MSITWWWGRAKLECRAAIRSSIDKTSEMTNQVLDGRLPHSTIYNCGVEKCTWKLRMSGTIYHIIIFVLKWGSAGGVTLQKNESEESIFKRILAYRARMQFIAHWEDNGSEESTLRICGAVLWFVDNWWVELHQVRSCTLISIKGSWC